ncbi:hypothetical protein KSF_003360 [Reticulibacter mediterranei]|uniref:Uncharacterized protein n=1 Tax=Reticulibacter mediterranei TaxID=2778369 RepID=A0A8J3IB00_9CHLR|nr:hypothetical protein [Reticulibacter mediterranei]GHO90288.1 hypothetical protein KSF_003360 [Reticulibacter mediterranei]
MESAIRLFKALPVESKQGKRDEDVLKQTISRGFLFAPEVLYHYPDTPQLVKLVDDAYGRSPEQLNQTFHKSWTKVRDASIEQLVIEQILHYFTTYGFEALGIFDQDTVYVPSEQLNVPELEEGIRLVVIRGYTRSELQEKLLGVLSSGVALHEETVRDVLDIARFVGLSDEEIDRVRNKEVMAALYDTLGRVPANPIEFLRYVVYRATSKTLLIKNQASIAAIKERDNLDLLDAFARYEQEFGLARLAEIFYRFKPLFLALRTNSQLKQTINKIRRLAEHHHQPMSEDTLNVVTARLRHKQRPLDNRFFHALQTASPFRKIRLAYALKFRTTAADSIVYRIRNGKSYATAFDFSNQAGAQEAYEVVLESLTRDIAQRVEGKTIFIPAGITYGLPATEKQFTGNLPSGTSVALTQDMVVGIHWENVSGNRIDLDLSLISPESGKIGWDGSSRSEQKDILFSGDMTDAPSPHGASELFYISQQARGVFILTVNYFNYHPTRDVPFKILVAHEKPVHPTTHYTVDSNNIIALSRSTMKAKQKTLGILVADASGCTFSFAESDQGNSRSARGGGYTEQARKYLLHYYTHSIALNDILAAAGAKFVDSATEADIDLSPESIDKTTILNLLQKKAE